MEKISECDLISFVELCKIWVANKDKLLHIKIEITPINTDKSSYQ